MYQAIVVKYHGPTNSRGARYKATCEAGSVSLPYDYALGPVRSAQAAAQALALKLGWEGKWEGGALPNGDRVYVLTGSDSYFSSVQA